MTAIAHHDALSQAARGRMVADEGGPFLLSDWARAVFIHYEVEPAALAPQIPFELDLRDGRAFVSLVAFEIRRLRPSFGGRVTELLSLPVARHGFLNLRTYVKHRGEPGIYFLAEWLPNALSVLVGPRTFGLPYRWGRLDYRHDAESGRVRGEVRPVFGDGALVYEARVADAEALDASAPGSLDEFLMERYSAFTLQRRVQRRFRVWHEPWVFTPIDLRVTDASLLRASGPWFASARYAGAAYSPGVRDVWMGRPRCINGPACGVAWSMNVPSRQENIP